MTVANTIWQQISVATKMACGARQPVASEWGLTFKVGGLLRYVMVDLDDDDTYSVRHVKVNRSTYKQTVLESDSGVYADALSEVVYHMVNK